MKITLIKYTGTNEDAMRMLRQGSFVGEKVQFSTKDGVTTVHEYFKGE